MCVHIIYIHDPFRCNVYNRAGHFRYFLILFNNKNAFIAFFIKFITYFCTSPILKAHSESNELDKKCKKSFFIIEKIKKYRNCPALVKLAKLGPKLTWKCTFSNSIFRPCKRITLPPSTQLDRFVPVGFQ